MHSHIKYYLWEDYLTSQTFKRALEQVYEIVRHRSTKRGIKEFPYFPTWAMSLLETGNTGESGKMISVFGALGGILNLKFN